ncbi:SCO family protein [Marinoscillum sp.]|uniref:SCO family protein n=1 Tax=Marinoscillum sp. TaxID=2024838 RepID=UPI003BA8B9D5
MEKKKKLTRIEALRISLAWLGLILVGSGCQPTAKKEAEEISLPFFNEATFTPMWVKEGTAAYDDIHTIAPFRFVDQRGDTVSNALTNGKVYVANFFFTLCPSVCPRMSKNLLRVQEAFEASEVVILSHTVMPWADTVERLQVYAELNDIRADQWHLLTGDKQEIYSLARESYFADEGFGKTVTVEADFLHTEKVILVDQQRRIRGVYNGTIPLEMARMIEDIQTLL